MKNVHGEEATDILGRKIELGDLVLIKGKAGDGFKLGVAGEKSIKFIMGHTGYNTSIYIIENPTYQELCVKERIVKGDYRCMHCGQVGLLTVDYHCKECGM